MTINIYEAFYRTVSDIMESDVSNKIGLAQIMGAFRHAELQLEAIDNKTESIDPDVARDLLSIRHFPVSTLPSFKEGDSLDVWCTYEASLSEAPHFTGRVEHHPDGDFTVDEEEMLVDPRLPHGSENTCAWRHASKTP